MCQYRQTDQKDRQIQTDTRRQTARDRQDPNIVRAHLIRLLKCFYKVPPVHLAHTLEYRA